MSDPTPRGEPQDHVDPASQSTDPAIADLGKQVADDEATNVRGGLNPQPLPPRWDPKI